MEKIIFKDKAGNVLYKKHIKTRNIWQYYAKNKQGRIVNPSGLRHMVRNAGLFIKIPRKSGILRTKEFKIGGLK